MTWLKLFFDWFLHLDTALGTVIQTCGFWTYGLLFLIIFCETGLIVTPFLPGDSLLFAAGTFAAFGSLDLWFLLIMFFVAAFVGDTVNYWIGRTFGMKAFKRFEGRVLKQSHLDKTKRFYAKYGNRTIVFARFVPIVRTLAPFVAGVGQMPYRQFLIYNVVGGAAWVSIFTFGGYFFGNIPAVKNNFTVVILGIILLSITPAFIEYMSARAGEKDGEEKIGDKKSGS